MCFWCSRVLAPVRKCTPAPRAHASCSEKLPFPQNIRISSWSYDMVGHAKKCVERYCELANKTTQQLYKVSSPCLDDHHFKEEETKSVGELSNTCSQIVLKCLHLARIGRPDILWSVNKLARSITKWTKACDKRLNRLISHVHHTCEYRQYCHVGNTAKQCRLGPFHDSDFAGDLEDSKSTSGGILCIFGSHTFVPISWMCKKQTSVPHSSTESEIISLDAGLRLDGIPALDLWDLIVAVLGNTNQCKKARGDLLASCDPVYCVLMHFPFGLVRYNSWFAHVVILFSQKLVHRVHGCEEYSLSSLFCNFSSRNQTRLDDGVQIVSATNVAHVLNEVRRQHHVVLQCRINHLFFSQ